MKKIFLSLTLLSLVITVNAQTLFNGGELLGTPNNATQNVKVYRTSCETSLSGGFRGIFVGHIVAGYFKDSIDVNVNDTARYMVYGAPGVQTTFLASYDDEGIPLFAFALGNATDSVRIDAIYVGGGEIVVGGKFNGTVNFNPLGTSVEYTAVNGDDAFVCSYSNGGTLNTFVHLSNTGFNASVTAIGYDAVGYWAIGGYFDGDLETNPLGSPMPVTASSGIDAFVGYYDYFGNSFWATKYESTGDVYVTDICGDTQGSIYVTGHFTNTMDIDMSAGTTDLTSSGLNDVFVAKYNSAGTLVNGMNFGGAGIDRPSGIASAEPNIVVGFEFEGTAEVNPLAGSFTISSNGLFDVAALALDLNTFEKSWVYNFGNSSENRLTFFDSYDFNHIYLATSFTGTMDVHADPAIIQNVTAVNNPTNAVVVELNANGEFQTVKHVEAQNIIGFNPGYYDNNNSVLMGNFTGTNVDIMPYDSVLLVSNNPGTVGYLNFFNRCHLSVDAQLLSPYECGTATASLYGATFGSIGNVNYSWSNGDYYDYNQTATGAFGDNTSYFGLSVNDWAGCYAFDSLWLYSHDTIDFNASVVVVPSTCGNDYGSATVTANNAVGPVTYYWSATGDTGSTTDSLMAGNYFVQVIDSFMCYVNEYFTVLNSDGPSVTLLSATNPSCGGAITGVIDINVTGGTAPYTFFWSNNATTEDLTNVSAGTYSVTVTDATGCTNTLCTSLTQPEQLNVYYNGGANSDCGLSTGWLEVASWGGSGPVTYQWDAAAGFQVGDSAINLSSGIYTVTVTDSLGCTVSRTFGMSDNTGPYAYVWNAAQPSCTGSNGFIEVDVWWGSAPFSYLWNTGQTTKDIYNVPSGEYLIQITDNFGCKTILSYYLSQLTPIAPEVCMVTVDSTGTQNVVVWDKTMSPEGDYFKIYREGVCNSEDFGWVGTVSEDSLSVFYDTVVNSDTRSWRYYVTVVDTCGFESMPSEINKTIHLSSNVDANGDVFLQWEAYFGHAVNYYEIYREQPANNGIYDLVDSVAPTTLTYLDTINFTFYGYSELEYYIDAIPFYMCTPSRAFNQNSSRSNHTRLAAPMDTTLSSPEQLANIEEEMFITIYPNPANDNVTIRVNGEMALHNVTILNQVGQQVRNFNMNRQSRFSTVDMNPGLYYVQVTADGKQTKTFKLIIAR